MNAENLRDRLLDKRRYGVDVVGVDEGAERVEVESGEAELPGQADVEFARVGRRLASAVARAGCNQRATIVSLGRARPSTARTVKISNSLSRPFGSATI